MRNIQLLDCTLRDGAYIVNAEFGEKSITGIIKRLQEAKVDIIECGWLKDTPHKKGTSFYHVPDDLRQYMPSEKSKYSTYVAMIDYNRYDINCLPDCDRKTIDAVRVVFPKDKVKEGLSLVEPIRHKGYRVFLQAANTFGYSDYELLKLAEEVNKLEPEALSIVDTYGAMHNLDLQRILFLLNNNLKESISLGFHSHNNQQLSFALSMQFAENISLLKNRKCIVDGSLCGMGRGAGNAPTELLAESLNRRYYAGYDMNIIMDTIDMYMSQYLEKYKWGYSISYMIAGTYACHVNNVSYLTKTHRTKSKDMKIIFEMLDEEARCHYDYDNLERVYAKYQDRKVDDTVQMDLLKEQLTGKTLVIILPGKSSGLYEKIIKKYIRDNNPIVIGINAVVPQYDYSYLFFSNSVKYEYAKEIYPHHFNNAVRIITSNIKTESIQEEYVVNYNDLQKREWVYYDNSVIMFLRLMSCILPDKIGIVGFDGYMDNDTGKYADELLEPSISQQEMDRMQKEILEMFKDYVKTNSDKIHLEFITPSMFEKVL